MTSQPSRIPFRDVVRAFREGRSQFPPEELEKYRGQWVAFSNDGRRILAGGPTLDDVYRALAQAGTDPEQTMAEYIDSGDACLGAAELFG